jgi:hypothetical protein
MGETTLSQALEEFKTVYMPARNLAATTRIEYANDLKTFINISWKNLWEKVDRIYWYNFNAKFNNVSRQTFLVYPDV